MSAGFAVGWVVAAVASGFALACGSGGYGPVIGVLCVASLFVGFVLFAILRAFNRGGVVGNGVAFLIAIVSCPAAVLGLAYLYMRFLFRG